MTTALLLDAINAFNNLLRQENEALETMTLQALPLLLDGKRSLADEIGTLASHDLLPDPDLKSALEQLTLLSQANAYLLKRAIDAQDQLLRVIAAPPPPDEQTPYGPGGGYALQNRPLSLSVLQTG